MTILALIAAAWADCTVIQGARVHLPAGFQDGTDVRIEGDRIAAVGAGLQADGCKTIDGKGAAVTAGLVETMTELGVVEIDLEDATRDGDAGEPDLVRAAFRAADSYNPRSTVIPVTRAAGITSAVVMPSGGLVSGEAAWVRLAGATQAEAVVRTPVAIRANLDTYASRAETLLRLRELLDDARVYAKHRAEFEKNQSRAFAASRLDLEALQPVLGKQVPIVIGADRAADVEALLRFAREQDVRLIVVGGAEAWMLARELAAAGVPVVVNPFVYGPGSFDEVHARRDNAALLARAGVPVILSSFSTHNARTLAQVAGNAVRGGMDHTDALRAITLTPAEAFGMADRGKLAAGAVADLVVWGGDPLEIGTRVEHVFVGGRDVGLDTRQAELFEKYRKTPGTPRPPLDATK